MTNNNDDALCSLFLSLSDPTRLKLLRLLATDERSVGFLADHLGDSQPKVSRHLAFLRDHNIVTTRRDGKHIYYSINTLSGTANLVLSAIVEPRATSARNIESASPKEHIRLSTYVQDDDLPVYLL